MNLRELKYLIAVAELKNFTSASQKCNVSQSTLSIQIKKFEEEFGVEVFERDNKNVLITQDGAQIINYAKEIIAKIEEMYEFASQCKSPFNGKIKIGAFPTIASFIFPKIVQIIHNLFPAIKIFLVEEKTDKLIEFLKNGEIDCAILAMPISDFEVKYLFKDEFYLAVSKKHKLANLNEISFEDLKDEKLMLLTEGHCLREQALEVCKFNQLKEEDFRATSLETLMQMVKINSGITFVPKIAIKSDIDVKYIKFQDPIPKREIGIFYRKTSSKKQIIDLIAKSYRNQIDKS